MNLVFSAKFLKQVSKLKDKKLAIEIQAIIQAIE